jgi:ribosomal protein S12 methylthiotransferase accessory factor
VRLLDITNDLGVPLGVPVVAAISARADGLGFAFGLAARASLARAARAALLEMGHMELAHHVVAAKIAEAGEAALNDADRGHLLRSRAIDIRDCELLRSVGAPAQYETWTAGNADATLQQLAVHLAEQSVETFSFDLTRSFLGLPAARVLAPALQLEPSHLENVRLSRIIAATGGRHAGCVPLF